MVVCVLSDLSMDEATDEEETDSLAPEIKSEDNAAGERVPLPLVQDSEDPKEASVPRKLKVNGMKQQKLFVLISMFFIE